VKKLIVLILAVAFVCASAVGCGGSATTAKSGGTSTPAAGGGKS
jgi:hypothetical protein